MGSVVLCENLFDEAPAWLATAVGTTAFGGEVGSIRLGTTELGGDTDLLHVVVKFNTGFALGLVHDITCILKKDCSGALLGPRFSRADLDYDPNDGYDRLDALWAAAMEANNDKPLVAIMALSAALYEKTGPKDLVEHWRRAKIVEEYKRDEGERAAKRARVQVEMEAEEQIRKRRRGDHGVILVKD